MGLGSLLVLIILLALLIAAGVFVVKADNGVEALSNYSSDSNLQEAHKKLKDASVTVWAGFAGIVVLIFLYLFFGSETAEFTGGIVITIFVFLTLFLCVLVGVFTIQALEALKKSQNYTSSTGNSIGRDIGLAIGLTIGVIGLLFFLWLFSSISRRRKASASKTAAATVTATPTVAATPATTATTLKA